MKQILIFLLVNMSVLQAQESDTTLPIKNQRGEVRTGYFVNLLLSNGQRYNVIATEKSFLIDEAVVHLAFTKSDGSTFDFPVKNEVKTVLFSDGAKNDLAIIFLGSIRDELIANNVPVNFNGTSEGNIREIFPGVKPRHIAEIKALLEQRLQQ